MTSMLQKKIVSDSCCTWATSSMKSCGTRRIGLRACTTVVCGMLLATSTAKRFTTFIFRQTLETIEPFTAITYTILICRMRAHVGRLSACGTIMSSAGRAGKACNSLEDRIVLHRRERSQRIRHFSDINRRDYTDQAVHRSISFIPHKLSMLPLIILTRTVSAWNPII